MDICSLVRLKILQWSTIESNFCRKSAHKMLNTRKMASKTRFSVLICGKRHLIFRKLIHKISFYFHPLQIGNKRRPWGGVGDCGPTWVSSLSSWGFLFVQGGQGLQWGWWRHRIELSCEIVFQSQCLQGGHTLLSHLRSHRRHLSSDYEFCVVLSIRHSEYPHLEILTHVSSLLIVPILVQKLPTL